LSGAVERSSVRMDRMSSAQTGKRLAKDAEPRYRRAIDPNSASAFIVRFIREADGGFCAVDRVERFPRARRPLLVRSDRDP
jgi:hypothetical protein